MGVMPYASANTEVIKPMLVGHEAQESGYVFLRVYLCRIGATSHTLHNDMKITPR